MQPPEVLEHVASVPRSGHLNRLWHDHVWQALFILTLVANLALLSFLLLRFEALPDLLPLHFDASGLPDRIEAKNEIMVLPVIGLIILILNTVLGLLIHRWERAATVLLLVGALLVQLLMWLAALNIVGGAF